MCYNEIRRKGACMIDFKTELGKKVQTLRESKGLSRQTICGIEDVLTTRQLQRNIKDFLNNIYFLIS